MGRHATLEAMSETHPHPAHGSCLHPAARQTILFPARDYISGETFQVQRCGQCGLARTDPQPTHEEIVRYYPSEYHGGAQRYPAVLERALNALYAWRARHLESRSGGARGRVLDIGCGRGWLLYQLARRGWTAVGTELTEESGRYARDVLGLDVRSGDLIDMRLPAESFDLVILWHVLEHIPDPAALLAEIARMLRPGGTLLAAVPNFGSPEARRGKALWFHLDVPRHLNHFDLPTLTAFLQGAGLEPVDTDFFAPEYDVFSAVQTALNLLGIRQNLLYNMVRARGARMLAEPSARSETIATLVLAPLAGLVAMVWTPLAAMMHAGATMSLYARKPESRGEQGQNVPGRR